MIHKIILITALGLLACLIYLNARTLSNKVSPIPLLIIHGDNDKIVPLSHGETLFSAAGQPKEMWVVQNGGHIEAFRQKNYRTRLVEYFERVMPLN